MLLLSPTLVELFDLSFVILDANYNIVIWTQNVATQNWFDVKKDEMFFIKLNYVNRKHKCICRLFKRSIFHATNKKNISQCISFFNYRKMMLLLQIMFKHCLFIVTVKQTQIIFVRMFCKNEISICNVEHIWLFQDRTCFNVIWTKWLAYLHT